ncbi:hypothetical protein AVEN_260482-1 [Araneus ventricosus]|uniref:Uncharacterized protein n=1 Tax=Araneus ventricosus TaxID=182803 RepID=A0A4Y2LQ06_ARAVE|nr:hypothetical protein AVEN_260482-1 [Araneus ventricosus]
MNRRRFPSPRKPLWELRFTTQTPSLTLARPKIRLARIEPTKPAGAGVVVRVLKENRELLFLPSLSLKLKHKQLTRMGLLWMHGCRATVAEKKLPAWAQTIKCMLDGSDRKVQVVKEMLVLVTLSVHLSEHQLALTYPPTVTENCTEEGSASPYLGIVGLETKTPKFYVSAEHQIVLQLRTLSEALAVLVASYQICHCEYPKQWEKLYYF